MEPTELFGITFRSASHMHWFVMTMCFFVISLIACSFAIWNKLYSFAAGIWIYLGVMSGFTSLSAIGKTNWGAINGPVWSSDCIWYNGMLSGIYFLGALLCYFVGRIAKKRARRIYEG